MINIGAVFLLEILKLEKFAVSKGKERFWKPNLIRKLLKDRLMIIRNEFKTPE